MRTYPNYLLGVLMRKVIIILMFFAGVCFATCADWSPDFQFQIEDADAPQTMLWLSGWAFALHATKGKTDYSLSECGYLDSKRISEILNEHHAGETISAEVASATIEVDLDQEFKCK